MQNNQPHYPQKGDKQMSELAAFEAQLHALFANTFGLYRDLSVHEVGFAMKQAALLAHDIEFMCQQAYEEYEAAEAANTSFIDTLHNASNGVLP